MVEKLVERKRRERETMTGKKEDAIARPASYRDPLVPMGSMVQVVDRRKR